LLEAACDPSDVEPQVIDLTDRAVSGQAREEIPTTS
jgi:hypothetical protein